MANLDASESSAQGRVQAWAEGLQMFKSHPLFGVGFGRYTDFNRLVAHNSFVHTLGELGLLRDVCLRGHGLLVLPQQPPSASLTGAEGWGEDLWQSGLALAVCAMFLSRQYSVMLFVWLALSAGYAAADGGGVATAAAAPAVHLARIAAMTAGGVICTYIAVRSVRRFGRLERTRDMASQTV